MFLDENDVLAPTIDDNLSAKHAGSLHIYLAWNLTTLSCCQWHGILHWVVSLGHLHLSHHELWD